MDRHVSEPEEGEVEEPQRPSSSTSLSQAGATPLPAPAELKIKLSASRRPSYEAYTSPALAAPSRTIPSLRPSSTAPARPKVAFGLKAPPVKGPVVPTRPPQSPRNDAKVLTMKGAAKEAATRAPGNGAVQDPIAGPSLPSPVPPIPPPPTPDTGLAFTSPRAATPPRPAPPTLPRPLSSVPFKPPLATIAQQDSRPSSPVPSQPLRADLAAEVASQSEGGALEADKGGEKWGHEVYGQQEGRPYQRERGGAALGRQTYIPTYASRDGRDAGRRDDERDYRRSRSRSAGAGTRWDNGSEMTRDRRSRSRSRSRDGDRRQSSARSDSDKHRRTSYHRDDDSGRERPSDRGHSSRSRDERDPYRSDRREREGERMSKRRASDDGDGGSRRGGDAGAQLDVILNYDEPSIKRRKREPSAERPRKNPSRSPPTPSPPRSPSLQPSDPLAHPLQKPRSRKGGSRSRSKTPDRDSKSSRRRSRSPPRAKAPSSRRRSRSPQRSGPYDHYGNRPGDRSYPDSSRSRHHNDRRPYQDQSGWGSRPPYGDAHPGRPYEQRPGQSQGGRDARRDGGAPRQKDGPESTLPPIPPRPSSDSSTTTSVPQGPAAPPSGRKPITLRLPPPAPPATSSGPSHSIFSDAPILPLKPPPPPPPFSPTFANPSPPSSVTYDEARRRPQSSHAPLHPSISALNSLATSPTTATPEPYSSTSRTPGPHSRRPMGTSGYVAPPGGDWLREPSPEPIALGGSAQKDARDEEPFVGSSHISEYTLQQKLGEGTFGLVWLGVRGKVDSKGKGVAKKGVDKEEEKLVARGLRVRKGDVVALKEILVHNESDGTPITSLREIRILKELDHPNVVPVVDIAYEEGVRDTFKLGKTYMVFPYMDHDLAGLLENSAVKFETHHIKQYAKQLLRGTAYLHKNGILHRDMKAANLLINNKGILMIADFGLARSIEKVPKGRLYTNCVVTRWYRPPELLLGDQKYHTHVDMWGVGCVIAEMFKKKPIFPGTSDVDQAQKIFLMCGSPNEHSMPGWSKLPGCEGINSWSPCQRRIASEYQEYGEDFVDLMEHLLVLDPRKRLTAVEALDHKWFWIEPYPTDPKLMPVFPSSHEFDRRKREELQQSAYPAPQPRPHPPLNHAHQPRPSFGQAPPHGRPSYGAPPQNGGPPGFSSQPMRFDMGSNPLPPPSFGGPPPGFPQLGFQPYPPQQQRQFQQPPFHQQQHQGSSYPPQRGPNYGDQRGPAPSSSGKVSMADMLSKRPVGGKPPPTGPRNGTGASGQAGGGQGGGAGGRAPLNYSDV